MVDLLVIIVENWEVRILNILTLYSKKEILDDQFLFVLIVVSFKITMISFSQFINNYYEPSIVGYCQPVFCYYFDALFLVSV